MKNGQTLHEWGCECGFCKAGFTAPNPNLDPIQNNCKYGWVLPDRCRYNPRLGCECGAYPAGVWDGKKYVPR